MKWKKIYKWKQTTTLTLLLRLTKRGFLTSQKIGKHTHYTCILYPSAAAANLPPFDIHLQLSHTPTKQHTTIPPLPHP
ncbi:hypothetical protein BGU72_19740 [Clostridioides difficile]|nr:hypothetical protein BGU72_19740 [Clostridioides difficile]